MGGGNIGCRTLAGSGGSSGETLSAVLKSVKPSSTLTDLKSANPSPARKIRKGGLRDKKEG